MHSTKLPLSKWLLASYLIVNSSKGISSVLITILGLALLVGTLVQYGFLVIRP
jgi:hypothetical protein